MDQLSGHPMALLAALKAAFMEREREASETESRAAKDRRFYGEQLAVIRQLELAMGYGESGGAQGAPAGGAGEIAGTGDPAAEQLKRLREEYGQHFPFLAPELDANGQPVIEKSVVTGFKTNRERAFAAARVYSERLRESALADAIFRTGETRATSPEAVRGSLGGLVRYGKGWVRERGDLVYRGELKPDRETILKLVAERKSAQKLADQDAISSHIGS